MKKISKNTLLLGGAVGLGVLCFVGANFYLRSYLNAAESALAGNYATRKVIVASVEVPAGGILSTDNLAVRSIPDRYLSSTAMGPDEIEMVAGQKIMAALKPGDPIDRGALERSDNASLSTTVAEGERAITFPVDEISSISGMLVPGDMIDLLFTGPGTTANSYRAAANGDPMAPPKELTHVRPILQAVVVMATGKTTQKRVVQTKDGAREEVNMDFSTVTLKVSPAQAQQVLIAQKLGQLTAVLRHPDDKNVLTKTVLDEATFRQVEGPPAAAAGGHVYLEIFFGGYVQPGGYRSKMEVGSTALSNAAPRAAATQADPAAAAAAPQVSSADDVRGRLGIPAPARQQVPNLTKP